MHSPTRFSSPAPGGRQALQQARPHRRVFLRQEGHLSADDLVDLVRRRTRGIGRATVYRTLQWMVEAGIARKVDFGEGRFRFEHSLRHPRHFHLDLQHVPPVVRVPQLGHRGADRGSGGGAATSRRAQTVMQVSARARHAGPAEPRRASTAARPSCVFARDALRIAIATERSGLEFYTRAAAITKDPRGRAVFQQARREEGEHLGTLEARYAELIARTRARGAADVPVLQGGGHGLFAEGTEKLRKGVDDQQALLIGIRCERGSHRFFKRYGERFEDSEGKRIFLEFADEERDASGPADPRVPRAAQAAGPGTAPAPGAAACARLTGRPVPGRLTMIDLHMHTTASDGRCTPAELVARCRTAGVQVMSVTDHDTVAAVDEVTAWRPRRA